MSNSLQPQAVTWLALLSMEFSRPKYWSGLPFPTPGDFPNPGIEPSSPTLQADSSLSEPPGKLGILGCVHAKPLQSCPTLCDPMDHSPPGSSVHGDSPGNNTGTVCHALLQGIFSTQQWNPCLPHCRPTLYHLSHWESDSVNICQSQDSNPFYFHSKTLIFLLYHAH